MKVKDLVQQLSKCSPDAEVYALEPGHPYGSMVTFVSQDNLVVVLDVNHDKIYAPGDKSVATLD